MSRWLGCWVPTAQHGTSWMREAIDSGVDYTAHSCQQRRATRRTLLVCLPEDRSVPPMPVSVRALLDAVADADATVRWEAAKALIALGDKRAVPPLIALAQGTGASGQRAAAVYVLGWLHDTRAIAPLVQVLRNSQSGRCTAAQPCRRGTGVPRHSPRSARAHRRSGRPIARCASVVRLCVG